MSDTIIFTIVAKNYLPLAHALGWSLRYNNISLYKFHIVVADDVIDKTDDIFISDYNYISVYDMGLENLEDLAFKYSVTEFCTAIKPASFKFLMNKYRNNDDFIYFDPDIFVFNNISNITDLFAKHEIIVTPHYVTPQMDYTGDQIDRSTLFVGIYNFGFVAIKRSPYTLLIIDWWHNRLMNQCYADIQDALHTDQKWMDFLSAFDNDKLMVTQNLGFNLAPWNLFERKIYKENNSFMVHGCFNGKIDFLTFVHFAGYDPKNLKIIHKDFFNLTIEKYPYYDSIRRIYQEVTENYNFTKYKELPYKFGNFENGKMVKHYHRRLYRSLSENGYKFSNPFSEKSGFYDKLQKAGMISDEISIKYTSKNVDELSSKINKINSAFRIFYKLLGAERYFTLLKYLNRFSRPENQTFLLGESIKKFY